jgi:predicted methyltransferase
LVISLALLHHLLLSQGFSIEDILIELKKYTKKYICIEFMPRGLWTVKKGDNYKVPEWYNLEWFKIEFEKQFRILHYEQIETNHVVFLGIIK